MLAALLAILPEGALASALGLGALCVLVFQVRRAGAQAWHFLEEQAFRRRLVWSAGLGTPPEAPRAFPAAMPIRDFD